MKFTPEQLIKRYDELKQNRGIWESHWQEVVDYFFPERGDINIKVEAGSKRRQYLFDSTGPHAMELLVSALFSMLTPPQLKWLEFTTGVETLDEDDEVRMFLQGTSRKFLNILNGSNFKLSIQEYYADLCTIGTAAMSIEDDEEDQVRFTVYPIAGYVIDENNHGKVDEIYRCFKWSAKKLVMEFGEENLSDKVKKAFEKGSPELFEVIHGVYPSSIGTQATDNRMLFTSQYVLKSEKKEIREMGFRQFPFIVTRWMKMAGEVYGRSPSMTALPEVKLINEMEKVTIKGAQKTIDPPLQVPDDGLMTRPNTSPGGLNYVRPGAEAIRPILNDARIDFAFQVTDRTRARIRECFYSDQLQLAPSDRMTATEVERRVERQMQFLGPILARFEDEGLNPMIDRIWEVARLRQIIKDEEIPRILSKMKITPRFSSTIARAQKASDLASIERSIQVAAPFIQADPSVMDNINGDVAIRVISKLQGLDQRMIRTEDEIAQMRQSRAQAAQEQMQLENQSKQADAASKMGNTVAQLQSSSVA